MTTSHPKSFLSDIVEAERIPDEKLEYFRARLKNRLHAMVLAQFVTLVSERSFTKADLARRLGKKPEQITRWLGGPGNWTLDTVSDLLLGMGYEPTLAVSNLSQGAIHPAKEQWKLSDRVGRVMFREKICSEHGALCFIEASRRDNAKKRALSKKK